MTSHEIPRAHLLDIIFENRNKEYGAYSLRKNYNSRLLKALVSTMVIAALLLFLIVSIDRKTPGHPPVFNEVRTVVIAPPPPVTPPQLPPPVRQQRTGTRSYQERIVLLAQTDPDKEMNPIKEVEQFELSSINRAGLLPSGQGPSEAATPGPAPVTETAENEKSFVPVESGPEFPGGSRAWLQFLNRHLSAPTMLDAGEKKVVLVRFMVDVDGSITGFRVLQSGGDAFDNEVIRVLKKMPKWKPAIQNGHPVAYPFTQPVTFVGLE